MNTKITYEQIKPYIEKRLILEQSHPENSDIRIFNYSQVCQFDKVWDEITMQCRGLIMNVVTGEIIARPFPKFFNYGEYIDKQWPLPKGTPMVTEKLDGSLGILYKLNGKPWIATRGAFMSDQAVWATDWYRKNINHIPFDGETMLWEIIYPENRIVVNYDFSGLVLLANIKNSTGMQINTGFDSSIRRPKSISITNLEELSKLDEPNSEGFVLYYPDDNVRMKIKFPEYVRLHKLVTGVSEIAIWEHLKDGNGLDDLLDKVPDEFYKWVKLVQERINSEFTILYDRAKHVELLVRGFSTRKEKAELIMKMAKEVSGSVFSLIDGDEKSAEDAIWKKVRPHGSSIFKNDLDL